MKKISALLILTALCSGITVQGSEKKEQTKSTCSPVTPIITVDTSTPSNSWAYHEGPEPYIPHHSISGRNFPQSPVYLRPLTPELCSCQDLKNQITTMNEKIDKLLHMQLETTRQIVSMNAQMRKMRSDIKSIAAFLSHVVAKDKKEESTQTDSSTSKK